MIYDFGCSAGSPILWRLVASLAGAGAVLLVAAGLSALGAVLQRRGDFRPTDLFAGWGFASGVMTLAVVAAPPMVPWVAAWLGFMMLGSMWHVYRRGYFSSVFWLVMAFPGLAVMAALCFFGLSGWNDFSHWVPNALYLFRYDAVPSMVMPATHSVRPAYPYAMAVFTYFASHAAGGFLVQGGAMFNFVLLTAFAGVLAKGFDWRADVAQPKDAFLRMGVALLFVTLGSPAFGPDFTLTNQADTAVTVLVATIAVLLWQVVEALRQEDRRAVRGFAMQVFFVSIALVLAKQVGIALLVLLVVAFLCVVRKSRVLKDTLRLWWMFVPAAAAYGVWQYYVAVDMDGSGFGVQPLHVWRFELIVPVLQAMVQEIFNKSGLFVPLFLLVLGGSVCVFYRATKLGNFVLLSGIVCGGYITFLFFSYLGSNFRADEAQQAASFYRYSTHVGLLAVVFLWTVVPVVAGKLVGAKHMPVMAPWLKVAGGAIAICVLPLTLVLQRGWLMHGSDVSLCAYRTLGDRIAAAVPSGTYMAVLDMQSGGLLGHVIGLQMSLRESGSGHSSYVVASEGTSAATLSNDRERYSEMENVNAIFIHPQPGTSDGDMLLVSDEEGWQTKDF